ncbi:hypothetical protein EOD41_16455 [Mucilaginibacter limnophilus]|uniref:Entericidin n=1 Tax=Mucilaginibacter limnophilus TaxID=1932778 RepID=A0A3S2V079_9SPHI|nr:hypothetical protein [Mucilaginibacter limnophilus]RVT98384.1 hypothetical protein EOD41_16455 [Mucilaginibacter limnophilus]
MKKAFLISCLGGVLALSACGGSNQQGAAGDSSANANNDTMTADTVIRSTDTSSIGVDHSSTGGTDALTSPNADSAAKKQQ